MNRQSYFIFHYFTKFYYFCSHCPKVWNCFTLHSQLYFQVEHYHMTLSILRNVGTQLFSKQTGPQFFSNHKMRYNYSAVVRYTSTLHRGAADYIIPVWLLSNKLLIYNNQEDVTLGTQPLYSVPFVIYLKTFLPTCPLFNIWGLSNDIRLWNTNAQTFKAVK